MRDVEARHQVAFFQWVRSLEGLYPALTTVFHVPNGERRDEATARKLKRMGVRAGVSDVVVAHASADGRHGLLVAELKAAAPCPVCGSEGEVTSIDAAGNGQVKCLFCAHTYRRKVGNQVDDKQGAFFDAVIEGGGRAVTCWSWTALARIVAEHLGLPDSVVEGL